MTARVSGHESVEDFQTLVEDFRDGDEGGPRHGFLPLVEKQAWNVYVLHPSHAIKRSESKTWQSIVKKVVPRIRFLLMPPSSLLNLEKLFASFGIGVQRTCCLSNKLKHRCLSGFRPWLDKECKLVADLEYFMLLQETKRETRSSNMIYSPQKKTSAKMHKTGRAGGGGGGGRDRDDLMTSFSNRDLKMLEVRQDYDFNRRPDNPADPGRPLNCNISVNLRNVLQVVIHMKKKYV